MQHQQPINRSPSFLHICLHIIPVLAFGLAVRVKAADDKPLLGFTREHAPGQRTLEAKFDALLKKENLREWMQRMSARPHHVGSPFGKQNAEFIASQFRAWGYQTEIEEFQV